MPQEIYSHTWSNGLTLLAERMPSVRSASFNILLPAGTANDPPEHAGLATILTDMMTRGAGSRGNRELIDALDRLGADRSESAGVINIHLSGVAQARNLHEILTIYADILRRPHLPEEELESAQALALQDLQGLEDDPQGKVMVELYRRHYPDPLGRDRRGTQHGIESLTIDRLRQHQRQLIHPRDVIIAVAGDIQWEPLKAHVEAIFGDWEGKERAPVKLAATRPGGGHITKDLEQTQIALAYPSVTIRDPDFYNARGAVGVLSQDMSSRLFTNVREKHGLCYAIHASHSGFKEMASVLAYSAAKPDLAQQTLDLLVHELRTLKDGIEEEELDRVKIGLKSDLIMRQESTSARAASLATDWYFLGRVRSLEELQAKVNGLTVKSILGYCERYPVRDVTLVTLGPSPLHLS
jgi:predicted Zn-dependent peptidase